MCNDPIRVNSYKAGKSRNTQQSLALQGFKLYGIAPRRQRLETPERRGIDALRCAYAQSYDRHQHVYFAG